MKKSDEDIKGEVKIENKKVFGQNNDVIKDLTEFLPFFRKENKDSPQK